MWADCRPFMGRQTKDDLLRVRVTEKLKADLERMAAERGEAISVVIRDAVKEYIARYWAKHPKEKTKLLDEE